MRDSAEQTWNQIAATYRSLVEGVDMLSQEHRLELTQFLHENLKSPASAEFGIEILGHLNIVWITEFVGDLLGLASYPNRATRWAQALLLSLDENWLRENIIEQIRPLLSDEESANALFQLASRIHASCGNAVFELALASTNPEVRDFGERLRIERRSS
jgi:hypothetical protein